MNSAPLPRGDSRPTTRPAAAPVHYTQSEEEEHFQHNEWEARIIGVLQRDDKPWKEEVHRLETLLNRLRQPDGRFVVPHGGAILDAYYVQRADRVALINMTEHMVEMHKEQFVHSFKHTDALNALVDQTQSEAALARRLVESVSNRVSRGRSASRLATRSTLMAEFVKDVDSAEKTARIYAREMKLHNQGIQEQWNIFNRHGYGPAKRIIRLFHTIEKLVEDCEEEIDRLWGVRS